MLREMMQKVHLVSNNLKTDWSINFPINETCQPTPACRLCYAKKGRLRMPSSLNRQKQVYDLFMNEDPKALAREIGRGYQRKNLDFLRWCGSGDLFSDAVVVLNHVARDYPDTVHWVVTRKPSMVALVEHLPNIYLMFSLDNTEESKRRKAIVDAMRHPRVYYSYMRQEMGENTMGASIVFNNQQNHRNLTYDDPKTCCPVDAKAMPIKGACKKCRKCFSPGIYR